MSTVWLDGAFLPESKALIPATDLTDAAKKVVAAVAA